ncbi:hypothetical protein GCM10010116_16990 [Microbispora rosea subsp. aerata]|nr:hypothetical protein [Microbispora rosea]GGO08403.1 hypothetical protein GCM10010116_16990 [Microbispora rosea subsp. aerata]GIH55417.1 hypothetical protein Mro02_23310 [Microbispora rosea subsp. aerata]GLJ84614.1 hypothetical protein GCM10017588_33420 [Microbispora rosea subsp. aerata]
MDTHHTRFVQAARNVSAVPAVTMSEEVPIMDRLVAEACREFPDWHFIRTGEGWVARSARVELSAGTLAELRHIVRAVSRWHVWRSDAGRWWASRTRPFSTEAEEAGAYRTVDGDDLGELCRAIAEQESLADLL